MNYITLKFKYNIKLTDNFLNKNKNIKYLKINNICNITDKLFIGL